MLLALLLVTVLHDWKVAFAGPLSGPLAESGKESLAGVKAALGSTPPLVELDDADDAKKAEAAFETAKGKKAELLIAAATGVTVDVYVAKARKAGLPLLLVGSCGPTGATPATGPSIAPDDPVFWLGTSAVEQAIAISNFLDVPCHSKQPGLIVEQTARGKEFAAALERNLCGRLQLAGTLFVAPHAAVPDEAMAKLKAANVDRLIVAGEPDLVDAVVNAQSSSNWKVPLFVADGMISAAAKSLWGPTARERQKNCFLLQGLPLCASGAKDATPSGTETWRTRRAFATTRLFLNAVGAAPQQSKKPKLAELVAALCDQRYGEDESNRPILDETHRSARQQWLPWKLGELGPVADEPSLYLDPDFGPPLRVRPPTLYTAEPGTKVVWLSYGDATSKAVRSIEADLKALGLLTSGYEAAMDRWIEDELLARALGKINKLFLKHEDGSFIPGVSFAISFTTEKPANLKESDYWRGVIAGDDPDAGGRAWPGEGRCEIYSSFMVRTIFQKDALVPPLASEDKKFMDGRYVWGTSSPENLRLKKIRNLIDGYAGSFAMTGAHEFGHVAGLNHDEVERSIMNVAEGGGLRETAVWWIPADVAVLERVLGRYGDKKKR